MRLFKDTSLTAKLLVLILPAAICLLALVVVIKEVIVQIANVVQTNAATA